MLNYLGTAMITVIGGIKGGTGKSIIAANLSALLANRGKDTLLVDGDAQGTTWLWSNTRNESLPEADGLTCIQLQGKAARTEVLKLASKYDEVIVDCGGRDTTTQRAALTVADLLLVPFPPRGPDVWTTEDLSNLVGEVHTVNEDLKVWAFINRADSQGGDNRAASEIINEYENITLIKAKVGNRKAFPNAHTQGLAVFEAKSVNSQAVAELEVLGQYCFNLD